MPQDRSGFGLVRDVARDDVEGPMAGKLSFLMGFGAGYVMGARAGRDRYDQIAGKTHELWQHPRVQEKADQAQHLVKEKVSEAGSAAGDLAHEAGSKVASKAKQKVGSGGSGTNADPGAAAKAAR